MKNIIYFFALLLAFVSSSCSKSIKGEGETGEKDQELVAFNSIETNGNFRLILIHGDRNSLKIESNKNLFDNLTIKITDNKLVLTEVKEVTSASLYNVYINFRELQNLQLQSNCKAEISGKLITKTLNVSLLDFAKLDMNADVKDLTTINLEKSAALSIAGSSNLLNITAQHKAKLLAFDFLTNTTTFDVEDKSDLEINVVKELKGKAINNTLVKYLGSPNKEIIVNDKAEVIRKE